MLRFTLLLSLPKRIEKRRRYLGMKRAWGMRRTLSKKAGGVPHNAPGKGDAQVNPLTEKVGVVNSRVFQHFARSAAAEADPLADLLRSFWLTRGGPVTCLRDMTPEKQQEMQRLYTKE